MKKKLLIILIGILVYINIIIIEICCIYAVKGDNTWNYLKEFWDWYKNFVLFLE